MKKGTKTAHLTIMYDCFSDLYCVGLVDTNSKEILLFDLNLSKQAARQKVKRYKAIYEVRAVLNGDSLD